MTILLISSGNPEENPGAASIAFKLYKEKMPYKKFFFGTYKNEISTDYKKLDSALFIRQKKLKYLPKIIKKYYDHYFGFGILFKLIKFAIFKKIKIVHFHSLGEDIPLLSIVIFRFLRKRVILTHHDFMAIKNSKLYPEEIFSNFAEKIVDQKKIEKIKKTNVFRINKLIFKWSNVDIYISELQSSIFQEFDFKNYAIINNRINACECKHIRIREPNTVLFVGRLVGKGFYELLDWVKINDYNLWIVGDLILYELVRGKLRESNYVYHGRLKSEEVFNLMHSATFLYAKSDCLDVYPTTVLESIAHNLPVVTSESCGNANFVKRIVPEMVMNNFDKVEKSEMSTCLDLWFKSQIFEEVREEITDFHLMISDYLDVYRSLMSS